MEEMAMLKTAERDNEWLQSNFEKVQMEHPNKFVAVSQGRVIVDGETAEGVVKEVERKGVNPTMTLVEFIPEKGLILIL
jgi:hypothetical protein